MDRRGFLRTLIGGVAATAAVRTWPFRVYSFSNSIFVPKLYILKTGQISLETLKILETELDFSQKYFHSAMAGIASSIDQTALEMYG